LFLIFSFSSFFTVLSYYVYDFIVIIIITCSYSDKSVTKTGEKVENLASNLYFGITVKSLTLFLNGRYADNNVFRVHNLLGGVGFLAKHVL